jgi:hypothetical protein
VAPKTLKQSLYSIFLMIGHIFGACGDDGGMRVLASATLMAQITKSTDPGCSNSKPIYCASVAVFAV